LTNINLNKVASGLLELPPHCPPETLKIIALHCLPEGMGMEWRAGEPVRSLQSNGEVKPTYD
jgi:hypothetical protein